MTTIQAEVPDGIYKEAIELARKEKVPVERLVSLALAQALGAWGRESVIAERAKRGNRDKFLTVLAKAPGVEPPEYDRLPEDLKKRE